MWFIIYQDIQDDILVCAVLSENIPGLHGNGATLDYGQGRAKLEKKGFGVGACFAHITKTPWEQFLDSKHFFNNAIFFSTI